MLITEAYVLCRNKELKFWHESLGYANLKTLRQIITKLHFTDLNVNYYPNFVCESWGFRKQHKLSFKIYTTTRVISGKVIYADLCGPISTETINGK